MTRLRGVPPASRGVAALPSASPPQEGRVLWGLPWMAVVLGVCVGGALSQPTKSTLWEHFFVDECSLIPSGNLTRVLPLKSLADEGEFLLELGIYGPYNPRLEVGLYTCALPSSALYRARPKGKYTKKVKLTFTKVPEDEDEGAQDEGKMKGDDGAVNDNETACSLPLSDRVSLLSGYGFVSCRGPEDREATVASLRAWRKEVQQLEALSSATKTKIIGSVGGGMALMLLACVACVVVRQRSSRKPSYFSPDRRPSQQSTRTHVTTDSSSQYIRN